MTTTTTNKLRISGPTIEAPSSELHLLASALSKHLGDYGMLMHTVERRWSKGTYLFPTYSSRLMALVVALLWVFDPYLTRYAEVEINEHEQTIAVYLTGYGRENLDDIYEAFDSFGAANRRVEVVIS